MNKIALSIFFIFFQLCIPLIAERKNISISDILYNIESLQKKLQSLESQNSSNQDITQTFQSLQNELNNAQTQAQNLLNTDNNLNQSEKDTHKHEDKTSSNDVAKIHQISTKNVYISDILQDMQFLGKNITILQNQKPTDQNLSQAFQNLKNELEKTQTQASILLLNSSKNQSNQQQETKTAASNKILPSTIKKPDQAKPFVSLFQQGFVSNYQNNTAIPNQTPNLMATQTPNNNQTPNLINNQTPNNNPPQNQNPAPINFFNTNSNLQAGNINPNSSQKNQGSVKTQSLENGKDDFNDNSTNGNATNLHQADQEKSKDANSDPDKKSHQSFFLGEGMVTVQGLQTSVEAFNVKSKKNKKIGSYTRSINYIEGYSLGMLTTKSKTIAVVEDNAATKTPIIAVIPNKISKKPIACIKNSRYNKMAQKSPATINLYEYKA